MPLSLPESTTPGWRLAVAAEVLYLVNMLPLPGIGFLLLLGLYWYAGRQAPPLARNHLRQTVNASLWAGLLLIILSLLVLGVGYQSPYVWVVVFLYFVTCHSAFILLGVVGLVKALNNQTWRWPLVGDTPLREAP